jgi:long-chain fatty acid transport protein
MNKHQSHFFRASAIATGVLLTGLTQQVSAAGFQLIEQGVSGLGTAFSGGAAQAEDASTVFFNPAGMTRLEGTQAMAAVHIIVPQAEFDDDGSAHALLGPGGLGTEESGDAGVVGVAPNFYLTHQLNDKVFLGLGVSAPFGLATSYDDDWIGRYHAIDSEVMTLNINPSVAFRLNDKFSVGIGANVQHVEAKLSNAVDTFLISAGAITGDGKLKLKGDDWSYGWNLGFLVEPSEGTRIGLHYRSEIDYDVEGKADFSGPITLIPTFTDADVTADVKLPATASLSLYHEFHPEWAVMADYSRTYWHVLKELRFSFDNTLPDGVTTLNWEDSDRYSIGLQHKPSGSNWTYRIGVAFDETPIPSSHYRTPRIPGEDRTWLAFGLGYKKSDNLSFDIGYAHLFVEDPKLNKPLTDPENTLRGALVGNYDASVDILSAQLNWKF